MAIRGRTAVLSHARGCPIRAVSHAESYVYAIGYPAAVAAVCELALVLHAAGLESVSIARSASAAAAFEIGLALAIAAAAATLTRRRTGLSMAHAALPIGVTLASCALFALANGAVGWVPDRTSLTGATALTVPLALGAGWVLHRALGSREGTAESLLREPPILAGCFFGAMAATRAAWIAPGSAQGLAVIAGGLTAGLLSLGLLRRARRSATGGIPARAIGVATLALVGFVVVVAVRAREPFPAAAAKTAGRPDVVLVVLDTVRADAAPAPEGSPFATPALARLAREGTRYAAAFSTSCWTLPAHASLFTGLLPREHRTGWESPHLSAEAETLAETFTREGYRTAGFSANVWVSPEFGFDRGFDRFTTVSAAARPYVPWPVRVVPGLFASIDASLPYDDKGGWTLASDAVRFLGERDERPAFVFLNLLEAHMPYQPPERYLRARNAAGFSHDQLVSIPHAPLQGLVPGTAPSSREFDGLEILYGAEIAYDDDLLGRIVDRLREAGRLDRTILVVVGDHGENLRDHVPLDHQLGLWDSLAHVPLIVRYPPRVPAGALSSDLVSLVDVRPFVLALAGLTGATQGGPLLGEPRRDAVFLAYDRPGELLDRIRHELGIDPGPWDRRLDAIRTADAKWIEGSDGSRSAFDLAQDPGETHDLVGETHGMPRAFAAAAARLREAIASSPPTSVPRKAISDETRRQLRSLGYVK